jgi:hypothetical protein
MSSVTRFIRQIPASASHLNAAALVAGAATLAFELVPSAGNIVGNYPPGYVQNSAALAAAIAAANAAASGAVMLRDMGKTILAPVGSLSGAQQYYRQVQLIAPAALSSGFVGNFGVLGAANTPSANVDYLSFYIPVSVAGVGAAINAYPVAAGQM